MVVGKGKGGLRTIAGWLDLAWSVFKPETRKRDDKRESGNVKLRVESGNQT